MAGEGQAGVYHPGLFDSALFQHNLWFCQHRVQSLSEEGRFFCSSFYSKKWNSVLTSCHRIQESSYPNLNHGSCLKARVAWAIHSSQEELYSQKSPKCQSPQTIVPQFRSDPQFRNDNIGVIPQFNTKQLLCLQIMQLTILGSIGNIKINKMLSSKSS